MLSSSSRKHRLDRVGQRIRPRVAPGGGGPQAIEVVVPAHDVEVEELGRDTVAQAYDRGLAVRDELDLHRAGSGRQRVWLGKGSVAPAEADPAVGRDLEVLPFEAVV